MMEETNDDQPEIVTHEEVALAEKEAAQSAAGGVSSNSFIPAPSPLPSFLASPSVSSVSTVQTPTPAFSSAKQIGSVTPSTPTRSGGTSFPKSAPTHSEAPGPMQTPFEASSAITVNTPLEPQPASVPTTSHSGSLFSWFSNSNIVHRVMEKTKSSVESVITTLDPGMKEVIRSGGDIEIVVTSAKDNKLLAVREAFQQTFGRATVIGKESQATTAAQPVGFTAGLKGAEDRINSLQRSGEVADDMPVVSIEGFIVELFPDKWYEMSCLILRDPSHHITLQTCSQPTYIPSQYIMAAQDQTPTDYPLRWSGLAVTVGQVIEKDHPHIGRADWQKMMSGVSRRDSLFLAALTLAHMYKQNLPTSFIS